MIAIARFMALWKEEPPIAICLVACLILVAAWAALLLHTFRNILP